MFTKARWLIALLIVVLLLGLGLIGASAAPDAGTNAPPEFPYLWPPIVISDFDNAEGNLNITYNRKHNEYFIVWQMSSTTKADAVRGARVSASGKLLANFEINGHPSKHSTQPAVAYDPVNDRYLVVFTFGIAGSGSNTDIVGRLIPWEGPDPSLKSFVIADWSTYQAMPDVAYGRAVEEFLVVWANQYASGILPKYISGRRIRASNGSFPGGSGSDLTIKHPSKYRHNPAVAYNLARNEYLIVYDDDFDVFGTRYTGDVNHDFGGEFPIAPWPDMEDMADVAACHAFDQYFVTWQSFAGGDLGIYGRFVSGSGVTGTTHTIYDESGHDREPAIACNDAGSQYLFAWDKEHSNIKYGIWGRIMQPGGEKSAPFPVQEPVGQAHRLRAAVAGGRSNYMAVWERERGNTGYWDIHGRLISPNAIFLPTVRGR